MNFPKRKTREISPQNYGKKVNRSAHLIPVSLVKINNFYKNRTRTAQWRNYILNSICLASERWRMFQLAAWQWQQQPCFDDMTTGSERAAGLSFTRRGRSEPMLTCPPKWPWAWIPKHIYLKSLQIGIFYNKFVQMASPSSACRCSWMLHSAATPWRPQLIDSLQRGAGEGETGE